MKKGNSNKVVIAIVVFVGAMFMLLACAGVLAAIAVPAFMRYANVSKTAEATATTRMMADYVRVAWTSTCKFPEPLPPTFTPSDCCGGEHCVTTGTLPEIWAANASMLWGPNYFAYTAVPADGDRYIITASADFTCGGPQHTVTVEVVGTRDGERCDATVKPPMTTNEFE